MTYRDMEGKEITLETLCRKEPAWASGRIRSLLEREAVASGGMLLLVQFLETAEEARALGETRIEFLEAFVQSVAYEPAGDEKGVRESLARLRRRAGEVLLPKALEGAEAEEPPARWRCPVHGTPSLVAWVPAGVNRCKECGGWWVGNQRVTYDPTSIEQGLEHLVLVSRAHREVVNKISDGLAVHGAPGAVELGEDLSRTATSLEVAIAALGVL